MKKGNSLRNQHEIAKILFEFLYKEGVATCKEVYQEVGNKCSLTTEEQTCLTKDGKEPQWHNDVRWACMYLKVKGYVVTTKRGIWKITKEGIMAF